MSEQDFKTSKAQRRTIHIGDTRMEVAMLPNGSYVFSQSEVTEVVDKPEISIRRFSGSKWLKSMPELHSEFDTLSIEGSNRPIAPISPEVAALYWQKCAAQGNEKAQALVIALVKRSLYDIADEAFGFQRSSQERHRLLREDLSKDGKARIEATRQSLERQTFTEPETWSERELKLKIRLREIDLEVERLRNKTDRYCLLPDKTGANTIPGITSDAVLEDVKRILKTKDNEEVIEYIYRMGFSPKSGVWSSVKVESWLFGMPKTKYNKLMHLLRSKRAEQPFEN